MPLTALQRTVLERYLNYRESPPTLGRLIAVASPNHARLVIVIALACITSYLYLSHSIIWLMIGMGVGAIGRDIGSFRAVIRLWPVVSRVLDYPKMVDLLAGKEVNNSSDD